MHDFLDLIQDHMIVVERANRARSGELLHRLKAIQQKAKSDESYILQPCPIQLSDLRTSTVEAKIDEEIRGLLKDSRTRVSAKFAMQSSGLRLSIRLREQRTTRIPKRPRQQSEQDTGTFLRSVDETVRRACGNSSDTDVYEVTVNVTWQLQQCIRDELDGSPDLSPALTISGNSSHAWAVSCLEYVETTWLSVGRQFLSELEMILGKTDTTKTLGLYMLATECVTP